MDDKDNKHEWAEAWQRFSVFYTERYYNRAYSKNSMLFGFVVAVLAVLIMALLG